MPVPDGQRQKEETGAAAGIAGACARPPPGRRRRGGGRGGKAEAPGAGARTGRAGQPLPGRREVERAACPALRPSVPLPAVGAARGRGGSAAPRVARGPGRPLPSTSCRGWGRCAPSPVPAPRRRECGGAKPGPLSPLAPPAAPGGALFPEGVFPPPSARGWVPFACKPSPVTCSDYAPGATGGAGQLARRGVWSPNLSLFRCVSLGGVLTLSGLHAPGQVPEKRLTERSHLRVRAS